MLGDDWADAFKAAGWRPSEADGRASAPAPATGGAGGTPAGGAATPHWGRIRTAAGKYGLDPSLLAGLVDFESSGNAGAINRSSGATGLGQVMPREAGFRDRPTQRELLDPDTNLDWSARILKSGLDRYGTEDKALAAYLGAIDARGNITGAVDANGTGGNQYIRTVRERQQRYGSSLARPPAAGTTPDRAAGGDDWTAPFRAAGWSPSPAPASGAPSGGRAPAPASGGGGAGASGAVFPVAGYTGKVDLHHGAQAGTGGSDLFAAEGTPVVSMVPGVVQWASTNDSLGGNNVGILGDDGLTYYYAHFLAPPRVTAGQRVGAGDRLGEVGRSGNAAGTPPHLHIGIGRGIQTGAGALGGLGRDVDAVGYLRRALAGAAPAAPGAPGVGQLTSPGARGGGIDLGDWVSAFKRAGWAPGS